MNFYISDWHYGHKNIMAYDNRPFRSVEEMNDALIANWNSAVSQDDTVYVLGDMFWCGEQAAIPILDSLHGKKILIRGNHDRCRNLEFIKRFALVDDYLEIIDRGRNIVLCHYPITCFKNHYNGWYHFYGHVHTTFEYNMTEHAKYLMEELYEKPCHMFNVGAMMPYMNYTPRTFDEIINANATAQEASE